MPDWRLETDFAREIAGPVAGIDEAGRGPWAGPVVAAAVILRAQNIPEGLDDSKALGEKRRKELFEIIMKSADVGVGIADVRRIDNCNILEATLWAMGEAVKNLQCLPGGALIDGNRCPELPCPARAIVKGDQKSLSIAAASIIAKVTRDEIMRVLAGKYPAYGWERNKGYGTKDHRAGLACYGVTPHHRRSFRPIRIMLEKNTSPLSEEIK